MNREEVMLKLLALGPLGSDDLVQITGWGRTETLAIASSLVKCGRLRSRHLVNQHDLEYLVPEHAGVVKSLPKCRRSHVVATRMGPTYRQEWHP